MKIRELLDVAGRLETLCVVDDNNKVIATGTPKELYQEQTTAFLEMTVVSVESDFCGLLVKAHQYF